MLRLTYQRTVAHETRPEVHPTLLAAGRLLDMAEDRCSLDPLSATMRILQLLHEQKTLLASFFCEALRAHLRRRLHAQR